MFRDVFVVIINNVFITVYNFYRRDTIDSAGFSCCHVSVCPSVSYRCSREMAKHRIGQTMPHDSPGAKCRWDRLNAGVVAQNWWLLSRSIVNLARLQVYHTERPRHLFAARSPWCSALHGFVSDSWSLVWPRCTVVTGYRFNNALERPQSRSTDPLLLIYSLQFRSAFLSTTPSQPGPPSPTTSVTDNLTVLTVVQI